MEDRFIRRKAVLAVTGLSNSTLYHFVSRGTFPVPLKLGKRTVAWKESEVQEWMDSRQRSISL
jgi:prophage regulatory protein